MAWELIWMLVILKIPVVYLCLVVWWAIRAKPEPLEPALRTARLDRGPRRPGWQFTRLRPWSPPREPHGRPSRGYRRQFATARMKSR
jgi:hypothetical protein